jgi:hypothetical protein
LLSIVPSPISDDMSSFSDPILFFAGENPEALKKAFIEAWAFHGDRFTPVQLAQHVFKDLPQSKLRAGQAGQYWADDLEVLDAVEQLRLKGKELPDTGVEAIKRRALQIADDRFTEPKDKLAALTLIARIEGFLKKEVEIVTQGNDKASSADMLAQFAKLLPN